MSEKMLIHLVGVDSRTEAGLKVLLKHRLSSVTITNNKGVALIDGDSIEGRHHINTGLLDSDIIMSVVPSNYDHRFVIKKPLNGESLFTTIKDAYAIYQKLSREKKDDVKGASSSNYAGNPFAKFSDENYLKSFENVESIVAPPPIKEAHAADVLDEASIIEERVLGKDDKKTHNEELFKEIDNLFQSRKVYEISCKQSSESEKICGQGKDVDLSRIPSHLFFNPQDYLYSYVLSADDKAKRAGKEVFVKLDQDYIFINHKDNRIYTSLPEVSLYAISLTPLTQNVEIVLLDKEHIKEGKDFVSRHSVVYYANKDYLISLFILWSARGRLPQGVNLSERYKLKLDDGKILDKLEIPNLLEIKELWSSDYYSIIDVVKRIDIPQRFIFSFFCVADVFDLFSLSHEKNIKEDVGSDQKNSDIDTLLRELRNF